MVLASLKIFHTLQDVINKAEMLWKPVRQNVVTYNDIATTTTPTRLMVKFFVFR